MTRLRPSPLAAALAGLVSPALVALALPAAAPAAGEPVMRLDEVKAA